MANNNREVQILSHNFSGPVWQREFSKFVERRFPKLSSVVLFCEKVLYNVREITQNGQKIGLGQSWITWNGQLTHKYQTFDRRSTPTIQFLMYYDQKLF